MEPYNLIRDELDEAAVGIKKALSHKGAAPTLDPNLLTTILGIIELIQKLWPSIQALFALFTPKKPDVSVDSPVNKPPDKPMPPDDFSDEPQVESITIGINGASYPGGLPVESDRLNGSMNGTANFPRNGKLAIESEVVLKNGNQTKVENIPSLRFGGQWICESSTGTKSVINGLGGEKPVTSKDDPRLGKEENDGNSAWSTLWFSQSWGMGAVVRLQTEGLEYKIYRTLGGVKSNVVTIKRVS